MMKMTPDQARYLWNSLVSESVGVADDQEVSNHTKFGLVALSHGATLVLHSGDKNNLDAAILLELWAAQIRRSAEPPIELPF